MRLNCGFWEAFYNHHFTRPSRVEIVSNTDYNAKHMNSLAVRVAEALVERHPCLKVFSVYRTDDPWNFTHIPFLWGMFHGYVIEIPHNSDFLSIKRTCMELELDPAENRIADIDVYKAPFEKISRKYSFQQA